MKSLKRQITGNSIFHFHYMSGDKFLGIFKSKEQIWLSSEKTNKWMKFKVKNIGSQSRRKSLLYQISYIRNELSYDCSFYFESSRTIKFRKTKEEWEDFNEERKRIKSLFITYFDGMYGVDPKPKTPTTYQMGVCRLDYSDKNILTVHLRNPGLLIGKGGETIHDLSEYLGCKIQIVEVDLLK